MMREFVALAEKKEEPFVALCERFGISRKTGYKWLNRFRENGQVGLEPLSRRPKHMPRKTPDAVVDAVTSLRREHPDWSAARLHEVLEAQGISPLPAPSTIDLILRRQREAAAQQELIGGESHCFEPNYRWSVRIDPPLSLADGKTVNPVCVTDLTTDFVVGATLRATESDLGREKFLAELFRRHGLPWGIVFPADPAERGAAPCQWHSPLSVWLMRLGVRVEFEFPDVRTGGRERDSARHQLASRLASLPAYQRAPLEERTTRAGLLDYFATAAGGLTFEAAEAELENLRERHNFSGRHDPMQRRAPISIYRPAPRRLPEVVPVPAYAPEAVVRLVSDKGTIAFQNQVVRLSRDFSGYEVEVKLTADPSRFVVLFGAQVIGVLMLDGAATAGSGPQILRGR